METLHQPIIVLGSPRSGTTFLGQILARHSSLAYAEEPRLIWKYGNDQRSDLLRADDARPEVVEHIRTAFAQIVKSHGATRLLEKTPANALRPAFVDRVFPDARFIHVIRHGLDSALSIHGYWHKHTRTVRFDKVRERMQEIDWRRAPRYLGELWRRLKPGKRPGQVLWGPRLPGMRTLVKELGVLPVSCLQWRMCVELTCAYGRSLPSDRYYECKLEDLDEDRLRDILAFCELAPEAAVIKYFQDQLDPQRVGAQKTGATAAEIDAMRPWMEPTMHWLGYEMPTPA